MTWNYRLVECEDSGRKYWQIREVYYDDEGKPEMVTVDAVGITVDDADGEDPIFQARRVLNMMMHDLKRGIILETDIGKREPEGEPD